MNAVALQHFSADPDILADLGHLNEGVPQEDGVVRRKRRRRR